MITKPGRYRMLTTSIQTGESVELDFNVKLGEAGLYVAFRCCGVDPVMVAELRSDCEITYLGK